MSYDKRNNGNSPFLTNNCMGRKSSGIDIGTKKYIYNAGYLYLYLLTFFIVYYFTFTFTIYFYCMLGVAKNEDAFS